MDTINLKEVFGLICSGKMTKVTDDNDWLNGIEGDGYFIEYPEGDDVRLLVVDVREQDVLVQSFHADGHMLINVLLSI